MRLTVQDIADMIDHSLLRPELTEAEVLQGCAVARENACVSVCVRPADVTLCAAALSGSKVLVTTVVGFPHGSNAAATKVFEARRALEDGAAELDMVINIGKLLSGDDAYIGDEIGKICGIAHASRALVKVILETHYLTDKQKVRACRISEKAGADFVKTSTGFAGSGAAIEDLLLMRRSCGGHVRIKAAGGVRTLDDALNVRAAGASRFGATRTVEILREARAREAEGKLALPREPGRLSGQR